MMLSACKATELSLKKKDTSSHYLRQSTKRNLSIKLEKWKIYQDLFSVHCFDKMENYSCN